MLQTINSFCEKYFRYILGVIFMVATIYIAIGGAELFNDSEGYLNLSIIRLPVYSLVVQMLYFKNFSSLLIVFQITAICLSIYLLINNFRRNLPLSSFWLLFLTLILLLPCLFGGKIANSILSEATAYALYLLMFHYLSLAFFTEKTKYIRLAIVVLFILMLTRGQFIYFIPVTLLLLIWISLRKKNFPKNTLLIIIACALPFLVSLTDRTYHKIANNHFVATPWTGLHLLTPALYVAKASDVSIYNDEKEKDFFNAVYGKLWERKLNIHHPDLATIDQTEFYRTKYTRIANWTIYDFGKELLGQSLSEDEKFIQLENITIKMAGPLIMKNFMPWTKLNFKNFILGFRSNILVLFYFILLVFSGILLLKRKSTNTVKVLFLGSLLTIANMATVSIGMHTIERFTFYNDWFFFLALFLMLTNLLKTETKTGL